MELSLGHVYQFSFLDRFAKLNGIYRVQEKVRYEELKDREIDLVSNLYELVGSTKAELELDLPSYINEPFYKLRPVEDYSINVGDPMDVIEYDLYMKFYSNVIDLEINIASLIDLYNVGELQYISTTIQLAEAVANEKWNTTQYDEAIALIDTIKTTFSSAELVIPHDSRNLAMPQLDKFFKYHPEQLPIEPDREDRIVSLTPSDGIYIPVSIISKYPIVDVKEFRKLMVAVDLGIFNEPELVTSVIDRIKTNIANDLGLTVQPQVLTYGRTWLEQQVYDDMVEVREALKGEIVNYYSEWKKIQDIESSLNNRINALEAIIIAFHEETSGSL